MQTTFVVLFAVLISIPVHAVGRKGHEMGMATTARHQSQILKKRGEIAAVSKRHQVHVVAKAKAVRVSNKKVEVQKAIELK